MKQNFALIISSLLLLSCGSSHSECNNTIVFNRLCDSLLFDTTKLETNPEDIRLNDSFLKNSCVLFTGQIILIDDSDNMTIEYRKVQNKSIDIVVASGKDAKFELAQNVMVRATYDYGIKDKLFQDDYTFHFNDPEIKNDDSDNFIAIINSLLKKADTDESILIDRLKDLKNHKILIYNTITKLTDNGKVYFIYEAKNTKASLCFEFADRDITKNLRKGQQIGIFSDFNDFSRKENGDEIYYNITFTNSLIAHFMNQ
jgi:hypothetical protein